MDSTAELLLLKFAALLLEIVDTRYVPRSKSSSSTKVLC